MSRSKRLPTKRTPPPGSQPRSPDGLSKSNARDRAIGDGPSAWVAAIVLALAIGSIYGRAVYLPYIFDDNITIIRNESIQKIWPLIGTGENHGPLNPPSPLPTTGRPLVNLSFAVNYYFGGLRPNGYHAFN